MDRLSRLARTKTFWVAISALFAAAVQAFFPHGESAVSVAEALRGLLTSPQATAAVLGLTLRDALARKEG